MYGIKSFTSFKMVKILSYLHSHAQFYVRSSSIQPSAMKTNDGKLSSYTKSNVKVYDVPAEYYNEYTE